MSQLSIKGILEKLDKLSKFSPLTYMTNDSKNKKIFFPNFDPMVWVLGSGVQDTPLQQFLLSILYSFDSIFQA